MKIEKMKKSASTLYTVFNIMQILVIVAAVILVVAAGLLFTLSGPMDAFTYTSLSFGDVTVRLAPGIEAGGMSKTQIVMILAAAVILLAVTWYGIRNVKMILQPMKEGRPFDEGIAGRFRTLGHCVLLGGIIASVLSAVSQAMVLTSFDLQALFKPGTITGVEYHYSFSITFLIAALALYLMSYVFRYGAELQKESDETL